MFESSLCMKSACNAANSNSFVSTVIASVLLGDRRRSDFLQVFHAPLLQEFKDWRRLGADGNVCHECQVLHQTDSATLHRNQQPTLVMAISVTFNYLRTSSVVVCPTL